MNSVRRTAGAVVTGAALIAVIAGCSSSSKSSSVATTEPATPASATPTSQPAAGIVVPSGPIAQVVADPQHRAVVALAAGGRSITVFPAAGLTPQTAPIHTVDLPDAAAAIADGPSGVVAAVPGAIVAIDPVTGRLGARTAIPSQHPLSITVVDADTTAVGTAEGSVILAHRDGSNSTIGGLVRVDSLAAHDGRLVALDRAQSVIAAVDLSKKEFEGRQRVGNGAANIVSDHFGRFLITNPRDGQLVAFYGDPPVERFAFPVPDGPYGVTYDDQRNVAWVAESGANSLVGFDLASGIPVQTKQLATVRQPDSIAVDPTDGTVFVASATGDGLQAIPSN